MKIFAFCLTFLCSINILASDLNVLKYGAVGDGKTSNTVAIQNAIDQCSESGGGRVIIPTGVFLTGTIELKDNVDLHISSGATLLGSGNINDYIKTDHPDYYPIHSLLLARDKQNIKLTGFGTIDGNGLSGSDFSKGNNSPDRPNTINFFNCRNVRIQDVTMVNSARWMQNYVNCEYVYIHSIKVYNHGNYNNDGIDINGCRNLVMSDCIIDSDDDAICLKSRTAINENITIANCIASSHCNAIKFGQSSAGGFRNILVTNCIVRPSKSATYYNGIREGRTGISIIMYDEGLNENIIISDIVIDSVKTPIFLKISNNEKNEKPVGEMKNIQLNNIIATNAGVIASSISGLPGKNLKNISLNNIDIISNGGGNSYDCSLEVPENEHGYPDNRIFLGNLPAFGLYIRHVENIQLHNVSLRMMGHDPRSALVADDVHQLKIERLNVVGSEGPNPILQFLRSKDIQISDLNAENHSSALLRAVYKSERIVIRNSDLTGRGCVFEITEDQKKSDFIAIDNFSFCSSESECYHRIINEQELVEATSAREAYKSRNIADVIGSYWELGDFYRLLQIAELDEWLREQDEVTVLAYGNNLIRNIPTSTLLQWQKGQDKAGLTEFLKSLILSGSYTINDFRSRGVQKVVEGQFDLKVIDDSILVNGYPVFEKDIVVANGMLHVISYGIQ